MSVERLDTKSMIEFDHISQLRIKPYTRDTTLCGRLHWRIGGSPDVQPIVPRRLFGKWRHARSESRSHQPLTAEWKVAAQREDFCSAASASS